MMSNDKVLCYDDLLKFGLAMHLSDLICSFVKGSQINLSKNPENLKATDEDAFKERNIDGTGMCLYTPFPCNQQPVFTCDDAIAGFKCNDTSFQCSEVYGGCIVVYDCMTHQGCGQNYGFTCDNEEGFRCLGEVFVCARSGGYLPIHFTCNVDESTIFDCNEGSSYDFSCGDLPSSSGSTDQFNCSDLSEDGFDCTERHIFNCQNLFNCLSQHTCSGGEHCTTAQKWEPVRLPDTPTGGVFSCQHQFTCQDADYGQVDFTCSTRSMFSCGGTGIYPEGFSCGGNGLNFECQPQEDGSFFCTNTAFHCEAKCAGPVPPFHVYEIFDAPTCFEENRFQCPNFTSQLSE